MRIYLAQVTVRKKETVADPEGKTISEALSRLGYDGIVDIRSGKVFSLKIKADNDEAARDYLDEISTKILSNPVIETYNVEFGEVK